MTGVFWSVVVGLGGAAGFALVWCGALALCAWLSGWRRLAARYPGQSVADADALRCASARVGIVDYSGVLSVRADVSGLAITPLWLFRPFHPPIEIPWSEIEVGAPSAWPLRGLRLRLPALPGARLRLFGRAARLASIFTGVREP